MEKLLTILFFLISANHLFGQTTTWNDDPDHSKLTFTVTHRGFSSILSLFQKFNATVTSTKPDFSDGVFELSTGVNHSR